MILALLAAALIATHPVKIVCNTTGFPGSAPVNIEAWTVYGSDTEHMTPALCAGLDAKPGTPEFAASLRVVLHESAHAKGIRSESCAEAYTLWAADVLDRFWHIPFFSPLSKSIPLQIWYETLRRPAAYHYTGDSCA